MNIIFLGKINDIRLEDVVPKELKNKKDKDVVVKISGKKIFEKGLTASLDVDVVLINGKPKKEVLEPKFVLVDPGKNTDGSPITQTIQTEA